MYGLGGKWTVQNNIKWTFYKSERSKTRKCPQKMKLDGLKKCVGGQWGMKVDFPTLPCNPPLFVKRPSILTRDRPLSDGPSNFDWPFTFGTVHFLPIGLSTFPWTHLQNFENFQKSRNSFESSQYSLGTLYPEFKPSQVNIWHQIISFHDLYLLEKLSIR